MNLDSYDLRRNCPRTVDEIRTNLNFITKTKNVYYYTLYATINLEKL